ncbi:GNAT family N-acetyltransferase [Marinobacter maroccanus]|uniref:GNAT family N-acetyltransferase n=1 Tax=Marinobacter maroccanus TaxID=2055143 RepID=A0A2S5ZDW0_9GAMM|nr:GNAT family N-acetyltransferase [Marinobacter maroccanus]PPI85565.1 GNAT family N-acetyltransferase [Marinobacter maroccanus]
MAGKHRKRGFVIREACEEDLPEMVGFLAKLALHVSGAPPHDLKESERKRLMRTLHSSLDDPNKLLLVAESEHAGLVGMGYVYIWRSQGIWEQSESTEFKSGVIDDIWVEPEFRGLGILKALLRDLVTFAEQHHASELILEYAASNKEAKAAWTKLGFKTTGVRAAAFTSVVKQALTAS